MGKRQLLFVTYLDENPDEGIAYVIELAKAMQEDIVLLGVQKKETLNSKFDDLMTGVTFAEAGEHETAQKVLSGGAGMTGAAHAAMITELIVKASSVGVHLSAEQVERDVVSGIRVFLKDHSGIDKVVLSPAVTEGEMLSTRDLSRLVRTASRPVVTMTRQSVQAMKEMSRTAKAAPRQFEPLASY